MSDFLIIENKSGLFIDGKMIATSTAAYRDKGLFHGVT